MRKLLTKPAGSGTRDPSEMSWLALEAIASVEVTSEDPAYPIESVFGYARGPGWRAAAPGPQTIRLVFDAPQRVQQIWLRFVESEVERTHEFTLRFGEEGRLAEKEIVRQQWTFSPQGSTSETEDYRVDLPRVAVMELFLDPDQGRGLAVATLAEWRLA